MKNILIVENSKNTAKKSRKTAENTCFEIISHFLIVSQSIKILRKFEVLSTNF